MVNIAVRLESVDLTEVDGVLERVRTALASLDELAVDGLDPTAMLGGLESAAKALTEGGLGGDELRSLAAAALGKLSGLLALPSLPDLGDIADAVEAIVERIGGLRMFQGAEDPAALVDKLLRSLGGSFDLRGLVDEIGARAAGVLESPLPDGLEPVLATLARFAADDLSASELPGLIGTILFGIDVDAARRLADGGAELEAAVAGAGDFGEVSAAIAAARGAIDAAMTAFLDFGVLHRDVDLLVTSVDEVKRALSAVSAPFGAFAGGVELDLSRAVDFVTKLDAAATLERLTSALPRAAEDLVASLVSSLRALGAQIESADSAAVRAVAASVPERLGLTKVREELEQLLSGLDSAFDDALALLRRLPLRRLRDDAVDALVAAQTKVMSFRGFAFLDAVTAPISALEQRIRELDAASVAEAVTAGIGRVRDAVETIPAEELRDAVQTVIEPVREVVDELAPALTDLVTEVSALTSSLRELDIDLAGSLTVDNIRGLREQLSSALGSGAVPEPVRAAVGAAAAELRRVDVSVTIGRLTAGLEGIDLDDLLAPLAEAAVAIRGVLANVSPDALGADLDAPFDAALAALDDLSVAPFIAAVSERFRGLIAEVRAFDPRPMLAPLEEDFQAVVETVRTTLDPAPLLAPLQSAYDALRAAVDAVDVEAAIGSLLKGVSDVPDMLVSAVRGRAGDASASGGVREAPVAVGFRFGDVLRPLEALLAEVRGRIVALAEPALGDVLAGIAEAVRGIRRAVDPDRGALAMISGRVQERLALVDPDAATGPLAELRSALASLVATAGAVEIGPGTVRVRTALDGLRLDVGAGGGDLARARGARITGALDTAGLRATSRRLAAAMDATFPAVLLDETRDPRTATEEFLDALFASIDPTPAITELDAIGEAIQAKLATLADDLAAALGMAVGALFDVLDPIRPERIIARIQAGIDRLTAELEVLDPSVIGAELTGVVDATIALVSAHSPAAWGARLGAVFDAAIDQISAFDPAVLLGGADPVAAARAELEALRPSVIIAPLTAVAASVSAALTALEGVDLTALSDLTASLEVDVGEQLEAIAEEWAALLDELALAAEGIEVSVSVSA